MLVIIFKIVAGQYVELHQVYSQYQQATNNDRTKTADEIERTCVSAPIPAKCINDKIETYERQQATNKDLQAQQDMVLWAFWAALSSGLGIFVTGVGIFYVRQTLEANRAAVITAEKALEITRHAHIIEQRPWIAVRAMKAGTGVVSKDVISVHLWVRFTNIGKTPATNVKPFAMTYPRTTGSTDMVADFIPQIKKWTMALPGKILVPGDWFEEGRGPQIVGKNILSQESEVYKNHISMRFSVGASYKSLLSDEVYHSARSYIVMVKKTDEGKVTADLIEFDEMEGGSDFT
jgi:hypothetical protein